MRELYTTKIRGTVIILAVAVCALGAQQTKATIYTDATGENFTGAGGGILDISSVEVTAGPSDLIFKINLTGDPTATDWGKYMVGIDSVAGGDTTGDGWVRPISMSSGMDYWIGSWADGGNGAEVWKYTGSWGLQNATYATPGGLAFAKDTSSVTVSYPYASLGLAPGSTIAFDVFTSGGGGTDSAVDALANPAQSISDWPNPYNSASNVDLFTIPVPEPSTCVLVAFGGLLVAGRTFRRRS